MASPADATAPTIATTLQQDSLEPSAAALNAASEDEDDDDIPASRRRGAAKAAAAVPDASVINGGVFNEADDEDDDAGLFGDDDGDDDDDIDTSAPRRKLDDAELDSGDDLDRNDRVGSDGAASEAEQEIFNTMEADMGLHPSPDPTDGEMYLLKIGKTFSFDSRAFDAATFEPPTQASHSNRQQGVFSAHRTAMDTIRWRKDPAHPSQFQSNARILRWSDGSLTVQIATNPAMQHTMRPRPNAPPQHKPSKPTPTSTGGPARPDRVRYEASSDSFVYLTAPSEHTAMLRVTNKITTLLTPETTASVVPVAEEMFQINQERADREMKQSKLGTGGIIQSTMLTEDPELARRKAELADKEQAKAQRKRENQEFKSAERLRTGGVGRRSYGGGLGGTLLEGEDELGAGVRRRRPGARGPRQRRSNRGEIYSDDDDEAWGQRGRTKEDEYDEDDGFLVASDEDEEEEEAPADDDEDIDEGIVLDSSRSRKRASPDDEQDAEGEPDEDEAPAKAEGPSSPPKTKRRRVVDDDEDDEE